MSRAWSSLRSIRISAARKTISARRGAGTSRHLANARLAASTAASTSSLFDRWKMATTSRVSAGLRSSKVCPLVDSTHSPSTKFLKTLVVVVPPAITGLVRVSVAIDASWYCGTSMLTTGVQTGKRGGGGSGSVCETANHQGHEGTRRKCLRPKAFVVLRALVVQALAVAS